MKVSEVSKEDCIKAAQLINMLQIAKYDIGGKDMCAGADSIRWLQNLAVDMAKDFSPKVSETSEKKADVVEPEAAVKHPSGLNVKSYNPGKVGKK